MQKLFITLILTLFSLPLIAGDGDKFITVSAGWQYRRTATTTISMEFEGKYHNAWEIYIDLATAYKKCDVCNKVCSDSFFDYKTWGLGGAYKASMYRGKNSLLRLRVGGDVGNNRSGFQCSIELGIELSYSLSNKMQLFVQQKNDFVFWSRDNFRNGILAGIKIPF